MRKFLPYLAGIGYAIIFGFSFMFTREGLEHAAPFHLLGLRFATAVLTLALLRLFKIVTFTVTWPQFKTLLPLAFFQPILYFPAETLGVQLTSSSQAGMMIAAIPIFVTILAAVMLKERLRPVQYPFILASVGGVIFILAIQHQGKLETSLLGTLFLLGAVLAAACFNIASRKAGQRFSPLQTTWVMMVIGAIFFNGIALIQHLAAGALLQYFRPLPAIWPALAFLGILSSVGAFFLVNYSLSKLPAAQGAVFSNLTTLISIFAGVAFLKESFAWYQAVGALIILAGVWGTNRFARTDAELLEVKACSR